MLSGRTYLYTMYFIHYSMEKELQFATPKV
jgi:hypothetical protein